jgi:hypothetical protein
MRLIVGFLNGAIKSTNNRKSSFKFLSILQVSFSHSLVSFATFKAFNMRSFTLFFRETKERECKNHDGSECGARRRSIDLRNATRESTRRSLDSINSASYAGFRLRGSRFLRSFASLDVFDHGQRNNCIYSR